MKWLNEILLMVSMAILSACNSNSPNQKSSSQLAGIHQEILKPTCAESGCHDGHFEPDFRTLQSTWYTTVFHPVTKNNETKSFRFRVVPGNRKESVLFERITNCCFVNQDDRMPQLDIGKPLPDNQIEAIGKWIDAGAPNIDGSIASQP